MSFDEKLQTLISMLETMPELAVAFSGGLDSRFLAHAAAMRPSGKNGLCLFHIRGPHVRLEESEHASAWAAARGLTLREIVIDPLALPEVRNNTPERCYFCKHKLFSTLKELAGKNCILCDGTNADDLGQYRPGLRALKELGIRSPLAECDLGKAKIRAIGAASGLDNPEQAARPCLLTRFAYGLEASEDSLRKLAAAESAIEVLLAGWAKENGLENLPDFRLRLLPQGTNKNGLQPELHIAATLPEGVHRQIAETVTREGFLPPEIKTMEKVGGYHDRAKKAKQEQKDGS